MADRVGDFEVGSLLNNNVKVVEGKRNIVYKWIGRRRNVVALMGFICTFTLSISRINLSIAIVAMTKIHPVTSQNGTVNYVQEFDWSSEDKGKILSSYFYGNIATQFLGGWLGTRYGGVKIMGIGIIITSLVTLLTPIVVSNNFYALVGLRVLIGIAVGISSPSVISIWGHWAIPDERTRLVTISMSGIPIGSIFGLTICGFLSDYFGWRSIFYITGTMGITWSIIWLSFVRERPQDDPWITSKELSCYVYQNESVESKVAIVYPYKQIFTSLPVWTLAVINFCVGFGAYTIQTELPTFFIDVFHFDLSKTGLVSSVPDIFFFISFITAATICDSILRRQILTITQVRKLFACGSTTVQALLMVLLTLTSDSTIMIILFSVIRLVNGFSYTTIDVGGLDLAPRYAGVLFGVIHTFGLLAGSLAPVYCGYIVTNKSLSEWNTVFLTISFVYIFGSVVYGTLGSAETQPWAVPSVDDEKEETDSQQ